MAEREGRLVRCAYCKSGRKTLLKREGQYVCRDCYAAVLWAQLMRATYGRERLDAKCGRRTGGVCATEAGGHDSYTLAAKKAADAEAALETAGEAATDEALAILRGEEVTSE